MDNKSIVDWMNQPLSTEEMNPRRRVCSVSTDLSTDRFYEKYYGLTVSVKNIKHPISRRCDNKDIRTDKIDYVIIDDMEDEGL